MTKKSLATDTKLLENTRRWRLTYKGLTANLYVKIRERSKRNGRQNDEFNLSEFRAWLETTDILRLWKRCRRDGFRHDTRPSIDRINCLDGYRFENMQVVTAKTNRIKGEAEKLVLWGKPVHQINSAGQVVAKYPSIKVASQMTGINKNNISSATSGRRKVAGGYRWEVIGNVWQHPDLLKASP